MEDAMLVVIREKNQTSTARRLPGGCVWRGALGGPCEVDLLPSGRRMRKYT